MCEIRLSVPGETLSALKLTPDEVGAELRLAAAKGGVSVSIGRRRIPRRGRPAKRHGCELGDRCCRPDRQGCPRHTRIMSVSVAAAAVVVPEPVTAPTSRNSDLMMGVVARGLEPRTSCM